MGRSSDDPQAASARRSDPDVAARLDAPAAALLEDWFAEHAGAGYNYLRVRGVDALTAEDLVHEAFLAIGKCLRNNGSVAHPRTYIITVVHNRWVRWLNSSDRNDRPHPEAGMEEVDETSSDAFDRVLDQHARRDDLDMLPVALEALPPRQRAVVRMKYFRGMSEVQIAEALEINKNTVRFHLSRAHQALEAFLSRSTRRKGESSHE
ncbi:RNA polymerase sigma factor [Amycolatopsis orientalis]|uniref:RNA polymerase sigma factor n=1 Tax=Amycolatopsis orientalis TaxID=31958 RepID=UPI000415206A|nr:RNA polymerase sigma factor [Amycolatopsis orientalis]